MSSSEDGWIMFWDITPLTMPSSSSSTTITITTTTTTGHLSSGMQVNPITPSINEADPNNNNNNNNNNNTCRPLYRFLACCRSHRQYVAQLHYNAMTDLLFSVADDGMVIAWNVALIDPLQHPVYRVMTEREMMVLAFRHDRGMYNPREMYQDAIPRANPALFCDVNKTSEYLAVGTNNGMVYLWKIPPIVRNEHGIITSVRK